MAAIMAGHVAQLSGHRVNTLRKHFNVDISHRTDGNTRERERRCAGVMWWVSLRVQNQQRVQANNLRKTLTSKIYNENNFNSQPEMENGRYEKCTNKDLWYTGAL